MSEWINTQDNFGVIQRRIDTVITAEKMFDIISDEYEKSSEEQRKLCFYEITPLLDIS